MQQIEKDPESWLRKNPYLVGIPVEAMFLICFFNFLLFVLVSRIHSVPRDWLFYILIFVGLSGWYFLKRAIDKDTAFWEILKFKIHQKGIKIRQWEAMK